ncbi:MAG: SCO family protein [Bacteroidetes bacterium]|nr:SCO family protein [Bacteroidota bacterium]
MIMICLFSKAQVKKYNYSEESRVYQQVADITISTNSDGIKKLSDLYSESPLIIAFVYTRCIGICNPFLAELSQNISLSGTDAKQHYKVLVLSFDTSDRVEDMNKLAARFNFENNKHWIFATTQQADILNKSVGFNPIWDGSRMQFDHEALLVGINQYGYVVKKLTGLRNPDDISLLLRELNGVFVASYQLPGNNSLLSCFTYNPATGERKISLGLLLLIAPFVFSLVIVFIMAIIMNRRLKNTAVPHHYAGT